MAKQTGLGDRLLVDGVNLSGDIGAIDSITSIREEIELTGIDKSAKERALGQRDGALEFTAFFNDAAAAAHPTLKTLPRTDRVITYLRGTTVGNAAAAMVAKQISYDGERDDKGAFTFKVEAKANGYGLDWGRQLTAGVESTANILTSPTSDLEGGVGNWITGNANVTIAATAAQAHGGTGSLELTSVGTATLDARHASSANGAAVTVGRAYLAQIWFRSATVARNVTVLLNWRDNANGLISTTTGSAVASSTSAWTLNSVLGTAPATAVRVQVTAQVASPAGAGEVHYIDDISLIVMPAGLSSADGAASSFGLTAYLQVTAFTGADATIKLRESSDDAATDAYTDVTGGAFTAVTTTGAQRIATATNLAVERYLRPVVTTSGGFSALSYNLVVVRHDAVPVV